MTEMKHLMTLMALVVAVTAGAQESNQYTPYNPDINGDLIVGVEDVLGLLTSYGLSFFPSMLMDSVYTFSYQNHYDMNNWSSFGYSFCEFLEWEAGTIDPENHFEANAMNMGFPGDEDGPIWYPIMVYDQELLMQELGECGYDVEYTGMTINVPTPLPNGIVFLITSGAGDLYFSYESGLEHPVLGPEPQYLDEYYGSEESNILHPMRQYVSWNGLFRRMD